MTDTDEHVTSSAEVTRAQLSLRWPRDVAQVE